MILSPLDYLSVLVNIDELESILVWNLCVRLYSKVLVCLFWNLLSVLPFQISNDESDFDITKIFEKLRNLEHPNLIRHYWITKYPNHINICLQYIPGQTSCIRFIYLPISLVLHFYNKYLEEAKIIHFVLKVCIFYCNVFFCHI